MSVSVVFLRAVVSAAEQLRISTERILHTAALPEDALHDISGMLSDRDAAAIINAVLALAHDPAVGLTVGGLCSETSLHLLGHLLMASPTLRDAATALHELGSIVLGDPAIRLQESAGVARITLPARDYSDASRFVSEVYMAIVYKVVQRFSAGSPDLVIGVQFAHARPRYAAQYAWTFQAPVSFDHREYTVEFAPELLDRALPGRDPQVVAALRQLIHENFVAPRTERSWSDRIKRALKQESDLAHVDFDQLAFRWGVTHRTLRRRVQGEGNSLSDLLDRARFERATAQLERPEESIKEVAERLGYAETSSFHRAFKRWAGVTPSEYRKRAQVSHAMA